MMTICPLLPRIISNMNIFILKKEIPLLNILLNMVWVASFSWSFPIDTLKVQGGLATTNLNMWGWCIVTTRVSSCVTLCWLGWDISQKAHSKEGEWPWAFPVFTGTGQQMRACSPAYHCRKELRTPTWRSNYCSFCPSLLGSFLLSWIINHSTLTAIAYD